MKQLRWILPLVALLLITPFTPAIDLAIENYFYYSSQPPHFVSNPFTQFVFDYGVFPAWIVVIAAAFLLFLSIFFKSLKKWRAHASMLLLALALGSGVIVHAVFKDHWGRPRPKQTIEFGGAQPFRPYYSPNFHPPEPSKSFPCGHCSMGFYFFSLYIVGKRLRSRHLTVLSLILTFSLGILLSIVRMAQGGHYFSDVLVAALIMWYTALLAEKIVFYKKLE